MPYWTSDIASFFLQLGNILRAALLDTTFNPPLGMGKGKLAEDRTHILRAYPSLDVEGLQSCWRGLWRAQPAEQTSSVLRSLPLKYSVNQDLKMSHSVLCCQRIIAPLKERVPFICRSLAYCFIFSNIKKRRKKLSRLYMQALLWIHWPSFSQNSLKHLWMSMF